MPPKVKIKKEDIIKVSIDLAREGGFDAINARSIAKQLNCSIQPIFSNFKTMEELKEEVKTSIIKMYHDYMDEGSKAENGYKGLGVAYIKFAKEESKLFQLMFMTETNVDAESYISIDKTFNDAMHFGKKTTRLNDTEMAKFHFKIWIATHGIATLLATKACSFTDDQISNLLGDFYKGQMALLEKGNKNEKNNWNQKFD